MFSFFSCFSKSKTTVIIKKSIKDFIQKEKKEQKVTCKVDLELNSRISELEDVVRQQKEYIETLDMEWEYDFNLEKSWNKFVTDLKRAEDLEKLRNFIDKQTDIFSFYYMIFPEKFIFYIITKKAVFVYKDGSVEILHTFWEDLVKHGPCHIIYSYTSFPFIGSECNVKELEKMFENIYSIF